MHVHVGDHFNGFPLETIQKFMGILFTFEPQILEIHPMHGRINGYCPGLRNGTKLLSKKSERNCMCGDNTYSPWCRPQTRARCGIYHIMRGVRNLASLVQNTSSKGQDLGWLIISMGYMLLRRIGGVIKY
jgi:hypothetical protein